jgi:hypothetical protein
MPVVPHRFLSLGCPVSPAVKGPVQHQDGMRCARAQEAVLKNSEGKGVVNSKLLPVTTFGPVNQHNKDRSSYF